MNKLDIRIKIIIQEATLKTDKVEAACALYSMSGSQSGQSEEPEVRGIWPEIGGKPHLFFLLF